VFTFVVNCTCKTYVSLLIVESELKTSSMRTDKRIQNMH